MNLTTPETVEIGQNQFHILRFPALKAANIMGKLNKVLSPVASGFVPLVGMVTKNKDDESSSFFDTDISQAIPILTEALTSLDGDALQSTLELLLLKNNNISVEYTDSNGEVVLEKLNYDRLNSLFCGELHEMFLLAYHVININYGNFFGSLLSQFGTQKAQGGQAKSTSMGCLTPIGSAT